MIGKDRFENELLRLTVEIVVQIVSQQEIDQHGCAFEIIAQRGRAQSAVQKSERRRKVTG